MKNLAIALFLLIPALLFSQGSQIPAGGGGGGMAIGGAVTGVSSKSLLFGQNGLLAQDNANLGWDTANKLFNTRRITAQANANVVGAVTFSGVGLNNATSGGDFGGGVDTAYCVKIDTIGDGGGGADTFSWGTGGSCTNGATGTDASGTQTLYAGATVTFAASTGHTLNDSWTFTAYAPISFIAKNLAGTEKTQILGASVTLSGSSPNLSLQSGPASGSEGNLLFSSTIGSNHNTWALASNDEGNDVDEFTVTEKTNNTYKFYVKQGTAGSMYLNPIGGDVGIGIDPSVTPAEKLDVGGNINATAYKVAGASLGFSHLSGSASAGQMPSGINPILAGTTGSIGGGLLTVGTCASGTALVTGARNTMTVSATPSTYPGDGNYWAAYVSSNDTVTVKVCATATLTPTASTYIVRVIP